MSLDVLTDELVEELTSGASLHLSSSWVSLSASQQRALLVLFDVYSDRLWGSVSGIGSGVRSMKEPMWRRFARDLLRQGPNRAPLLPWHVMWKMYPAAASDRPLVCPVPAFTVMDKREKLAQTGTHVDFLGFVEMLGAIATVWWRQTGGGTLPSDPATSRHGMHPHPVLLADDEPSSTSASAESAALPAMLEVISCAADHREVEILLSERQVSRATNKLRPRLILWDLLGSKQQTQHQTQQLKQAFHVETPLPAGGKQSSGQRTDPPTATATCTSSGTTLASSPRNSKEEMGSNSAPPTPRGASGGDSSFKVAALRAVAQAALARRRGEAEAGAEAALHATAVRRSAASAEKQAARIRRLSTELSRSRSEVAALRKSLSEGLIMREEEEVHDGVVHAELAVASAAVDTKPEDEAVAVSDEVIGTPTRVPTGVPIRTASAPRLSPWPTAPPPYAMIRRVVPLSGADAADGSPLAVSTPWSMLGFGSKFGFQYK